MAAAVMLAVCWAVFDWTCSSTAKVSDWRTLMVWAVTMHT